MVFRQPESFIPKLLDMPGRFHAARDSDARVLAGSYRNQIQNRKSYTTHTHRMISVRKTLRRTHTLPGVSDETDAFAYQF
jgi:hypothetical protein